MEHPPSAMLEDPKIESVERMQPSPQHERKRKGIRPGDHQTTGRKRSPLSLAAPATREKKASQGKERFDSLSQQKRSVPPERILFRRRMAPPLPANLAPPSIAGEQTLAPPPTTGDEQNLALGEEQPKLYTSAWRFRGPSPSPTPKRPSERKKAAGIAAGIGRLLEAGFTFSFFYRIPPTAGNENSAENSPNFPNSERKDNSNSKNKISMNSDRNFGDFDRNSVIFHGK